MKTAAVILALTAALGSGAHPSAATAPGANGKLLMVKYRDGGQDLFAADTTTGEQTRLTQTRSAASYPVYSPDGAKIAFSRSGQLFVMNADGTNAHAVTTGNLFKNLPEWSPDGTRLAYEATAGFRRGSSLWVVNADGTGKQRLTSARGSNHTPRWSPDSTELLFTRTVDGAPEIFVMDSDGSNVAAVASHPWCKRRRTRTPCRASYAAVVTGSRISSITSSTSGGLSS